MIKICIIGNTKVGKSSWKNNWSRERKQFTFDKTVFKFSSLKNANVVFLMFDVTDLQSYRDNILWVNMIRDIRGDIPICLIGNKIDVKKRKVYAKMINFHRKQQLYYFEMSAKSQYNFEKPLLWAKNLNTFEHNYTVIQN